jgi:hypothetical protein
LKAPTSPIPKPLAAMALPLLPTSYWPKQGRWKFGRFGILLYLCTKGLAAGFQMPCLRQYAARYITQNEKMKYTLSIIFTLIAILSLEAQVSDTLNQNASPKNGINQLTIKYYGIDFTKEQRKEIENIEIEFIFSIDETGNPTLSKINGVTNQDIIDSLKQKTDKIENFNPQIRNGIPEPSIYFMKLTFPSYKYNQLTYGLLQGSAYNEAKLEDFEYLKESEQRFDMIIGGLANQFFGRPSEHLGFGGGMKIDLGYAGKNNLIYGLNMSFYGNNLKQEYPINSTRE